MTLYEFNLLDEQEQGNAIWDQGVDIAARVAIDDNHLCWILLYQIDAFYVELYYDIQGNEIRKIKSFASTDALEPYFDNISLKPLLKYTKGR